MQNYTINREDGTINFFENPELPFWYPSYLIIIQQYCVLVKILFVCPEFFKWVFNHISFSIYQTNLQFI